MDPNQPKRDRCKWCQTPLPEHKTRYCSPRCQHRQAQRRRKRRVYNEEFRPLIKAEYRVAELAERYGVSEDEVVERARERAEVGSLLVWPSRKWFSLIGIPKDRSNTTRV